MFKEIKTKTSRNKKYGSKGDTFIAFGETFTIVNITKEKLKTVAEKYFEEEGFLDSNAFIQKWKQLHPRKGYDPEHEVYVHEFKKGVVRIGQLSLKE